MSFFLGVLTAIFAGFASSQTSVPCEKYSDPNYIYMGPDHQILYPSAFSSNKFTPPESSLPYLKRIAKTLRARGTLPVIAVIPNPGVFYLGQLDPQRIKGSVFEKSSSLNNFNTLRDSYLKSIQFLESLGFEVPNLLDEMNAFVKSHPSESVFLKRDNHWSLNGSNAAATAISKHLSRKFPDVHKAIHQNDYSLTKSGTTKLPNGKGYDGLIQRSCANHTAFEETWDKFDLVKTVATEVSAQQLFGTEVDDVVLVGTSYSTLDYQSGFANFLSAQLGSEVANYSMAGGGPVGSILEYFMSEASSSPPKVLVWEIPGSQIAPVEETSAQLNLTIPSLRQLLPMIKSGKAVGIAVKTKLVNKTEIPIKVKETIDGIGLKFSELNTRKIKLTLIYTKKKEEIELRHPRSKFLTTYFLEIPQEMGNLEGITIQADGEAIGDVEVSAFSYM
jgi:hypothetical protein